MSFEVDRYSSAWAHIALCADLTWATEPPDDFIIANQRLWAQHRRVSQALENASTDSQHSSNQYEQSEKLSTNQSQKNSNCNGKSVKDVIPESRLAQFYGNFYYDEDREKSYTNGNEKTIWRGYNGQGCDNSDLTECWMLPEVEYWFRKLLDDAPERASSRRRRCRVPNDDDLLDHADECNVYQSAVSERWKPPVGRAGEEAALTARVLSVRGLWSPRAPSPPPAPRKMRARRRQPRRLVPRAPLPGYRAPALLCDPMCKFQFEAPLTPLLVPYHRAYGRLSSGVQVAVRSALTRASTYRATAVCRYAPACPRPRYPERRTLREQPSPSTDPPQIEPAEDKSQEKEPEKTKDDKEDPEAVERSEEPKTKERVVVDEQLPSTSTAVTDIELKKKRLYSTVLSMSAPAINITPVRLQNLTPALLKLNPKIILPAARIRPVESKFEELEKEALEQYKASDESIDTKFRDLEKQAEDQYSTSNSNTSCSSGQSGEKSTAVKETKRFLNPDTVASQNFPDLNSKGPITNLKNFHIPPRGEKKEQTHRPKLRSLKDSRKTAADYEIRDLRSYKNRWSHIPKKRHLALCMSDLSDEEMENLNGIKDAPKNFGKMKLSAHGGGDMEKSFIP